MRKSKTGTEEIRPRKKGNRLAAPKMISTPGANCKQSSLTACAVIDSILNRAKDAVDCKQDQDCLARSVHEDLLNP